MPRRLLLLALGAAAGAALLLLTKNRGRAGDPSRNGGRARSERLRRELEQARERLREDLARMRGHE